MLARHGFWWLLGAALAGLLPAIPLTAQITRTAVEQRVLDRLAQEAARLAGTMPASLPADAWLLAADGSRLGGDVAGDDGPPRDLVMPGIPPLTVAPLRLKRAAGLLASHPVAQAAGGPQGAVALWQPATRVEAMVAGIMLRGLRDATLLLLFCVPAAWIGARLWLAPLAVTAAAGATLLDALRTADLLAEETACAVDTATVLAAAAPTDPLVAAAAAAAGAALERLAAAEAAVLQTAMAEIAA